MKRFNIRVYGLWLNDQQQVLVGQEKIPGGHPDVIKFPGGGLEFGEGLEDALKREWMEELQLEIQVREHVYTTHFFQPSAFDDSQVISVYYKIVPLSMPPDFPYLNDEGDRYYFEPVNLQLKERLSLPIDRYLAGLWQDWIK